MQITKDIAEKIQTYEKAVTTANALYEELEAWLQTIDEDWDNVCIVNLSIVDKPEGEPCGNGEYSYSTRGCCEDDYSGARYYPIAGSEKYFEVAWTT